MSMGIDLSTPLSDKERAYLAERGRYTDIERADSLTGVDSPPDLPSGDGSGPQATPLGTAEQRAQERERLLARLAQLSDSDEETEPVAEADDKPYAEWTVSELDDELKARKLSTGGTKPEKVSRLEQDDANAAE